MKRLIKLLTVIVMMTLTTPAVVYAQSASESYDKGMALMKSGDYSGAIASFQASMAINKSEANKKKCNTQIAKCRKLMKKPTGDTPVPVPVENEKKLRLSKERVPFPSTPMEDLSVDIITEPFSNDWMATVEGNADWLELSKSMDGKSLILKCKPTDKTIKREVMVAVTYGKQKREVKVVQWGKDVKFAATPLETSFKMKGGKQLVNINCNSDTVYEDGKNWKIKQVPDWVKAETTATTLILEAQKVEKNDPEYKTGRESQIIIVSQNWECVLKVSQKRSLF